MKSFLLTIMFFAVGCASPAPTGLDDGKVVKAGLNGEAPTRFVIETVAKDLEVPWGFAFLPNKDLMFTERPGRVRLVEGGRLRPDPVFTVPDVEPSGESGLMDISLHPDFASNGFVYLAYAYDDDGKKVKVVRYKYDGKVFVPDRTIIDKIPGASNHAGTRARFGPDGKLYITTGDATNWNLAQNAESLSGKTLRLNADGSVPPDNPFAKNRRYRPEIWTIGHRNAQGLAWQPGSGLMFQTEHGPSFFEGRGGGADEVNIVEEGKNYGWPVIYGDRRQAGMESPLLEYTPACAPASAMFYAGNKFPAFKGDLLFGCLRGVRMIRVKLDGRKVLGQQDLLKGSFGRIREVAEGPDGFVYFSTSNRDGRGTAANDDDRILRIVPID